MSPLYPRAATKLASVDWAARAIVIICALNLNDVFFMAFGINQGVSLLMLGASLYLITKRGRGAVSGTFFLLLFTIASYLIMSSIYTSYGSPVDALQYYRVYIPTVVIMWSMTGYVATLPTRNHLMMFLKFTRNVFLAASASVWMSPILYNVYVNLPLDSHSRMGGFFGNQTEASYVSLFAMALTLAVPFNGRAIQVISLVLAIGAVVLTFAKSGMAIMVIILAWNAVRKSKGFAVYFISLLALIGIVFIQNIDVVLQFIVDQPFFGLGGSQRDRVLAVASILRGDIDDQTSTGRTYIWRLVISHVWATFPFGSGLGTGHSFVGGLLENGVWQGTHNTYLMMWVEGGIVPFISLCLLTIALARSCVTQTKGHVELYILVILVAQMMAGHTALSLRYHNLMMSVVIGIILNLRASSSQTPSRGIRAGNPTDRRSALFNRRGEL